MYIHTYPVSFELFIFCNRLSRFALALLISSLRVPLTTKRDLTLKAHLNRQHK